MGMEDDHLALADRHLEEVRIFIARQGGVVHRLKEIGADTAAAEALLATLLTTQARMIEHRRLIVATIALEKSEFAPESGGKPKG